MWSWTFPSNDVANNVHADGKKESCKISDNIYCTIFNLADPIPAYTKLCLMPLINEAILWIYNLQNSQPPSREQNTCTHKFHSTKVSKIRKRGRLCLIKNRKPSHIFH